MPTTQALVKNSPESPKSALHGVLEPKCSNYKHFQTKPTREPNFAPNGASVPNYNRLNVWPLQFLRTGFYARTSGYLSSRTTDGFWWSSTTSSIDNGFDLTTYAGYAHSQRGHLAAFGFARRGVGKRIN